MKWDKSFPVFYKINSVTHILIDKSTILQMWEADGDKEKVTSCDCCCGLQSLGSLIGMQTAFKYKMPLHLS